ncbi:putative metalloprotease CJM1_0395 family protein [Thauera sp.]|uniref:putative metalloprotease CJM1_0395 family protein n=1 Tax=Thauera sp. TaxID=1905334 RepID=UPI002D1F9CDE|nr:putative metalloprotease CJM1_0395 family protein [Thauera sp.]
MHDARAADAAAAPAMAQGGGDTQATPAGLADALSEAEQRQVAELAKRDREVRAHEMAHVAAGAGLVTRGASYTYQTGPDGQRYAIGGEVGIDTSPGRTPEETLAKAERIRAAALAPAEPSGQDRQVAAQAARMANDARLEIARREFAQGDTGAEATRDGAVDRGMRAAQAYSEGLAPRQAPTLSASA